MCSTNPLFVGPLITPQFTYMCQYTSVLQIPDSVSDYPI